MIGRRGPAAQPVRSPRRRPCRAGPRSSTTRSGGGRPRPRERLGARRRRCAPRTSRARRLIRERAQDLRLVVDDQDPGHARLLDCRATSADAADRRSRSRARAAAASATGTAISETTMVRPPPGVSSGSSVPPMASVEAAGQRQSEADAGRVVGVAEPLERAAKTCSRASARDARAAVDDPQLDPVAERAAGDQRRAAGGAVAHARWRGGWRGPAPAARGRRAPSGRSSGRSTTTGRPSGRRRRAPGPRPRRARSGRSSTASAPACSRLMSSRLSTSAASRSSDSSAVSSSSSRSSVDHSTSRLSRLVTAALADASGVRRSWLTAASSAVRIRSASASGAACAAVSASRCCSQHDGGLGGEGADEPLVVGVQRSPLQGERELVADRDDGVASSGRGHDASPAQATTVQVATGPRTRTPSPGASSERSSSVTDVRREGLADPVQQRGQRDLPAQDAAGEGGQRLRLGGRPGGLAGAPGGEVDHGADHQRRRRRRPTSARRCSPR